MYRPEAQLFSFRLRKNRQGESLEGVSRRYTATALIGLAGEDKHIESEVLGKDGLHDVCGRLISDLDKSHEMGEIALTVWASRTLRHPHIRKALDSLERAEPASRAYPTVELSWALTALVIDGAQTTNMALAEKIADVLIASFRDNSGVFPHVPVKTGLSSLRAHVSCFADFVYPIQALSHFHLATGNERAKEVASKCAEKMCEMQGRQGQWWWHFDVRTGRIIEYFPVYSVHQDSMAPMALFALAKACGKDYSEPVRKGLLWLFDPADAAGTLVDMEQKVIWRKIARREPRRLVRGIQAGASRIHPTLRIPGLNYLFPPVSVDYESRPYHMGWILYAWNSNITKKFTTEVCTVDQNPS
jgi:hypothetical protein